MRGLTRWVVLLLLVVCVPVKALAFTGALACLHDAAIASADTAPVAHEHCDGHGADDGVESPATTPGCSSCAPCCAAAAPAPEVPGLDPVLAPPAYTALPEPSVVGIVSGVPLRPPR